MGPITRRIVPTTRSRVPPACSPRSCGSPDEALPSPHGAGSSQPGPSPCRMGRQAREVGRSARRMIPHVCPHRTRICPDGAHRWCIPTSQVAARIRLADGLAPSARRSGRATGPAGHSRVLMGRSPGLMVPSSCSSGPSGCPHSPPIPSVRPVIARPHYINRWNGENLTKSLAPITTNTREGQVLETRPGARLDPTFRDGRPGEMVSGGARA